MHKPRRSDYDLVFFQADNIQVAHVYLFLLYIMTGQWQNTATIVAFLSILIVGWLEYSLEQAGISDKVKRSIQTAASTIEKTLNAHRLIPNYISSAEAAQNWNSCTDHLQPFDRRTTNPRSMRRQEWATQNSTAIGGSVAPSR